MILGFILGVVVAVWIGGATLCFGTEALLSEITRGHSFLFWLGWPFYALREACR